LNCDLIAMKLMHPYVIDTSCIFNIHGDRNRKSKLQHLAKSFLGEDIQMNIMGHSSIEDSITSLKLTKLKLSKDLYFGDAVMQSAKSAHEWKFESGISNEVGDQKVTSSLITTAVKNSKKSTIITTNTSDLNLKKIYSQNHAEENDQQNDVKHIKANSAKDVVKKAQEIIWDNDFNMLHFNILEDPVYCTDEDDDGIATDEKIVGIIPKIDKWINKVWKSVASKGLFVVLFGGNEKNNHGLSMIRVKH
jgi:RNA exonuclease 1